MATSKQHNSADEDCDRVIKYGRVYVSCYLNKVALPQNCCHWHSTLMLIEGVVVSPVLLSHISHNESCYSYYNRCFGVDDFASSLFIRSSKKKEDASEKFGLSNTPYVRELFLYPPRAIARSGLVPEVLNNQVMYNPSAEPMEHTFIGQELVNNDDDDSVSDDNCFSPNDEDDEEGIGSKISPSLSGNEEGNNMTVDDSPPDSNTAIMTPNTGGHVSDELKVKIKLMKIMQNHTSIPLTRTRVMKDIYEGDGFEPLLSDWRYRKSICADVASRKQIYVQSFQKTLYLLLTNVSLVKEENLSFPHAEQDPTLPVRHPELQGKIDIDELHHGQWWIDTWEKRCNTDRNKILIPIILYIDGIAIDNSGQMTLTPLSMTLGIFNTLTWNSWLDACVQELFRRETAPESSAFPTLVTTGKGLLFLDSTEEPLGYPDQSANFGQGSGVLNKQFFYFVMNTMICNCAVMPGTRAVLVTANTNYPIGRKDKDTVGIRVTDPAIVKATLNLPI
eukprot:jgi/Psemu1/7227/gm1.7227_g